MDSFTAPPFGLDGQGLPAGPCTMVIFGSSGDLAKRMLIPAIYNLARSKLLPDQYAVV